MVLHTSDSSLNLLIPMRSDISRLKRVYCTSKQEMGIYTNSNYEVYTRLVQVEAEERVRPARILHSCCSLVLLSYCRVGAKCGKRIAVAQQRPNINRKRVTHRSCGSQMMPTTHYLTSRRIGYLPDILLVLRINTQVSTITHW
jgi:hypothetical protein